MKNIEFKNHIKNECINIRNAVNGNHEIEINGEIGQSIFSDGYTFEKFKNDLNMMDDKIVINIKSMGGNLFEALAIYDHIRSLKNKVVTKIVGSSASAATIISLAGDKRYITENSRYLIHKPMLSAMGNSDDFEQVLNTLKDLDKQVVDLYVKRTKLSTEEVLQLMKEEKFISAEEAIEKGFIDDYVQDKNFVNNSDSGDTNTETGNTTTTVENNINNINNIDMTKEILDMLQVTNDAEAKEKIEFLLKSVSAQEDEDKDEETQEATNEDNNDSTEIPAKEENASEEVEKDETKNEETEEKEDEAEKEETEEDVENKEDEKDEETVEDLKAKITALEKSLKEKEEKEAENAYKTFTNILNDAVREGKIVQKSYQDWVNVYNREGAEFATNLLNAIPEPKTNTVDAVVNTITPSNKKRMTREQIMNDWKQGLITGDVADNLLKQIK